MSRQRELARDGVVRVFDYRCTAAKGAPSEPEQFTFAAISLVRSGVFGFRSEGRTQLLSEGFALLSNPGQSYEISHEHQGYDRCVIFRFEEHALEEVLRGGRFSRAVLPPSPRMDALKVLAERRLQVSSSTLGLEELGLSLAANVAARLDRPAASSAKRASRDGVYAALAEIERSFAEDLRLRDLARAAGLSPFHFLRTFKQETGVTPHRFLVQTRMRRALELLRDTARPVTEIALDVGFPDLSNFINTFRRSVGCAPSRFRKAAPEDLISALQRPSG
jgi:AraC family transcriptional regulator